MAKIIISKDGSVRGICSKEVSDLLQKMGQIRIDRASHVEPLRGLGEKALEWLYENGKDTYVIRNPAGGLVPRPDAANLWFADMLPVGHGVLGPFSFRDEALQAEIAYLQQHNIPVPLAANRGS